MREKSVKEEEEEDQGGKVDQGQQERRRGRIQPSELGFRSDRAAKTNHCAFCSRFVDVATIDVRSPADRI